MTLKYYFHPLASYCHKVLIALYNTPSRSADHCRSRRREIERGTPGAGRGKFPVLRDEARNCTVAESTIIISISIPTIPVRPVP
jgi:glutathione S-transferase